MKPGVAFWQRSLVAIALVSTLLVAACQPLVIANPSTTAEAIPAVGETPSVAPTTDIASIIIDPATKSGGVALTYQTQHGNDQSLLPIDKVLYGNDWSTMIDDDRYLELAFQRGCIELMLVKPDNGVDPVSLVYSEPATSTAVTPTTWSEYSVFDRVVTDIEDEAGQRVIVVTPETAIEAVIPVVPAGACDATFVGDELNRWSRESRLTASELDRLLVATAQSDGSLRRTLIIINPSGGATCSALKTACSRCMSCGLEFVCKVVQELRSWIC